MAEAFLEAPEEVKREIFQTLLGESPKGLKCLLRLAHLDRGGNRIEVLAKRPAVHRGRLDSALTGIKEPAPGLFAFSLRCFLGTRGEEFEKLSSMGENGDLSPVERRDMLAAALAPDPAACLLASIVVELDLMDTTVCLPDPLREVPGMREQVGIMAARLREIADALDRCEYLWSKSDSEEITAAEQLCSDIRESLLTAAERLGEPLPEWGDVETLDGLIEGFAERLLELEENEGHAGFFKELAEAVLATEMKFPIEWMRQAAGALQQQAARELEGAATADPSPVLPMASYSGTSWLRYVAELPPTEKAKFIAAVKAVPFAAFGEFLESIEPAWIGNAGQEPPPELSPSAPPVEITEEEKSNAETERVESPLEEIPAEHSRQLHGNSDGSPKLEALPLGSQELPPIAERKAHEPGFSLAAEAPFVEPDTLEAIPEEPEHAEGAGDLGDYGQDVIPSSNLSLPNLARACLKDLKMDPATASVQTAELVCRLLNLQRVGLAYQLAESLNNTPTANLLPPVTVLRALAVTTALRSATPAALQPIQEIFSEIHPSSITWNDSEIWKDAVRLFVFAATIPMALRSPLTAADEALEKLHLGKWPKLREIAEAATSFAQNRLEVSWDTLSENLPRIEWEERVEEYRQRADQRWQQSNARTITFQGATEVWKHWLKPGELLHQLLDPIRKGDLANAKSMSLRVAGLNFETLLAQTQSVLGQRTKIIGGALKVLRRQLDDVACFAQDWAQLVNSEPRGETDFVRVELDKLRRALQLSAEAAKAEVRGTMDQRADSLSQSSGAKAIEAIDACLGLFESATHRGRAAATIEEATAGCLLEIPSLHLGKDWECSTAPATLLHAILEGLADGGPEGPDASMAFERHCENGDHLSSLRLLDRMCRRAVDEAEIQGLEQERQSSLEAHRSGLLERIEDIEARLSAALQNGLARERTVSDGLSAITAIRGDLRSPEELLDFVTPRLCLDSIDAELALERAKIVDTVRLRLGRAELDDSSKARLEEIIESGDLYLANDYLDKIEDGQALPESEPEDSEKLFLRFFDVSPGNTSRFQALLKYISETPRSERQIIQAVEERKDVAGLELGSVSGAHSREYAEVLKLWFSVKEARKLPSADSVSRILRGLGFNVTSVRPEQRQNRHWIFVDTEALVTPPVPTFGSEAKGRYRILCDFNLSAEKELQAAMDSGVQTHGADLIFYFGRMPEKVRQGFAQILRKERRTVAVVDDLVMLALATVRGRKLDALLELTLPFSGMMPYTTQGSLLPPEMFFGRQREVAKLESISTDSSCLLYGGRQIGKSVLLRHVEHRVNSRPGSVAVFIDFKSIGLGVSRDPTELWTEMSRQLREREPGIFPGSLPAPVRPTWFAEKIGTWLSGDPKRRILMLLDEADAFLEADGKSDENRDAFRICTEIRDLMVETKHRFKVVLAGLHNVQRSTRTANNPLAQYGTPICVGPLLTGGEAREAQALIEKPLARLGIFFESPRLVIRILAQTNYYPNLIQIYCQALVDHVRERQSRKGEEHPVPYRVSSGEVEELYERRNLRANLHKRFELTLELDPRFRLIAYLLALHDRDYPDGLDSATIRREAMEWWAVGFRQGSNDGSGKGRGIALEDFETLLDEMEGLGILRHTGSGATYRLRSPNVVSLLGTESQIEGVLLDSEHWEAPKAYSPETFRNPLTVSGIVFRNPFTANQEARLRRVRSDVVLLAGSDALGLDQVSDALKVQFGSEYFHLIEAADLDGFCREIDGLVTKRLSKQEGKTLALVPALLDWDASWIDYAEDKLAKLRHTSAHLGIVFLLDPGKLWTNRAVFAGWERARTILLRHWSDEAIGPWLNEASIIRNSGDARAAVSLATGNWPAILRQLARSFSGTLREAGFLAAQGEILLGQLAETSELESLFGLNVAEPMRILQDLLVYGEFTESEASDMVPTDDRPLLAPALDWAESLSLVSKKGQEVCVDPFVRKVLELQ
ncbi:MAG: hypothetical protein JNK37_14780 [Verrucomicrobiales bacterium]|nr:hypothetical protein [Verrucomicrobiales bacterium]